uniref:Uncharacterized protein n=1 Tax=Arundo donax TaxID=35708 RepID=A0A0A9B946_ARUDO
MTRKSHPFTPRTGDWPQAFCSINKVFAVLHCFLKKKSCTKIC